MDTLTHGLLGAALAALPLPRRLEASATTPFRASLLVSVLAAELPDLDYLLPAEDTVLHTLSAHRGYSHCLLAIPLVALAATLLTRAFFRRAAFAALFARALLCVPLAHLLPDLWTGWGTRLFLPFSERRLALDWTMVIDPLFTAPLALAALAAAFKLARLRPAMAIGAGAATLYVVLRVASSAQLTREVSRAYPSALSVQVFPALLGVTRWRYVVRLGSEYAAGSVALGQKPREAARHAVNDTALADFIVRAPTVREALSWARFPVVRSAPLDDGATRVSIADLRYHLNGSPTLTFVIDVDRAGVVKNARLDRGGSPSELLKRLRQGPGSF
ncbi:MAG TPA: metal-dependent hydrolase [Polyangiaceae bacterium]|nr:metal-dependent hydrolase [Polyangiaceae bacterium]